MTKTNMISLRATRVALALVAGLLTLPAFAAGLRVTASANALPPTAVAAGAFGFTVSNDGATAFDSVRLVADPGHALECASVTAQSRNFVPGGLLGAGDHVSCTSQPIAGLRHVAGVSVIASSASAAPQERHLTFTTRGAATPSQGIVVLVAGAVLQDTNSNGILNAGEIIAYNYSVLNLGTLALSGLTVADNDGAVTCPQTTLATGANMVCTRNHVISAAEEGAGIVANLVDIVGSDGSGPVGGGDFIVTFNLQGTAGIRMFKSPLLQDDVDSSGYASAGDLLRYTFVVKNSNAQSLSAVNVIEPDPTLIDTPITCAATTLGGQAFTGLGSGVLQSNDVILCTADHTITTAEATAGSADNLAESSGQPAIGLPVSGTGASAVVIPSPADVTIVKTLTGESGSQPGIAEPGETLTYSITLSNAGGADALNYGVLDPLDANVDFVSADNGGINMAGVVTWSGLTVPGSGNLVLTVVVTVSDPVPIGVEQIANLAYNAGTQPPDCTLQPTPAACVVIPVADRPRLSVTKTADTNVIVPGGTINYTITVTNVGTIAANNVTISDPVPASIASFTWTCAASGGVTCPNASGSGAINEIVPTFPVGAQLTYTVLAVVTVNPEPPLVNVVTVTPSSDTVCEPSQTAPPCTATVPLGVAIVAVPVDARWALLLLIGLLAAVAGVKTRSKNF
ncbi:hypothetical protein [Dokdonella sp.]|uniref:DUF7507 domain-containing protein n=1 Tax=Dokdonella sp. TaxID=2291710 RepID=UPI0035279C45